MILSRSATSLTWTLGLLAILSACAPAPTQQPSFYQNLSLSGTSFDPQSALGFINGYRNNNGLPSVRLDPALTLAAGKEASIVADRVARKGKVVPSGNLPARVREAGYPLGDMKRNVSAGYYTIAEAFSGWRESKRHRETMLMADATDMGIAAVRVPNVKYKVYWALIMARPEQ